MLKGFIKKITACNILAVEIGQTRLIASFLCFSCNNLKIKRDSHVFIL